MIDVEEEASKKRRREQGKAMAMGDERDDVVIISYMGADRAVEETEADALTMCFTDLGMSVRNFVCVADCAAKPIFIGYHTDETRKNTRYVKKMIPSTTWLKNVNCDVMILIGHGFEGMTSPSYITFCESPGVDANGVIREISPNATRLWSCSSWEDREGDVVTKPADGVTLSEVVDGSKLVMMLCCHGEIIAGEYEFQDIPSTRKPDLLIFKTRGEINDTSMYVFLALLMTSVETNYSNLTGSYDASIKRHIYQVFLWIQTQGTDAEQFWRFLMTRGCVYSMVYSAFQIKGTTSYTWRLRDGCKQVLLDELRTLSLGLCKPKSDAFGGWYTWVDSGHNRAELEAWAQPPKPAASGGAVEHDELRDMLLQLKGMMLGYATSITCNI
jgi:hypothetical protein